MLGSLVSSRLLAIDACISRRTDGQYLCVWANFPTKNGVWIQVVANFQSIVKAGTSLSFQKNKSQKGV